MKLFLFKKHLRNGSVFETKVKIVFVIETFSLFFFQKMLKTKMFYFCTPGPP